MCCKIYGELLCLRSHINHSVGKVCKYKLLLKTTAINVARLLGQSSKCHLATKDITGLKDGE